MTSKILVIGAGGQIGVELTEKLRDIYGKDNVIASDIKASNEKLVFSGPFEILDAMGYEAIKTCVKKYHVDTVYLMAAMLSATSEKHPELAWQLNTNSLFNVLNLAKDGYIKHIFWPSSIAVFGPNTPKNNAEQHTIMEPTTVYGISKQMGERWCEYYHNNYDVDVRSLRYPGIISWKNPPGGGTTDYAIDIYHEALKNEQYTCFLNEHTELPMMFMDDAIDATVKLMQTKSEKLSIRSSYNISAISFTPKQISESIKKVLPNFSINYKPDFRQKIADSWPKSINDSVAKTDWGWKHEFNLDDITNEMLDQLSKQI